MRSWLAAAALSALGIPALAAAQTPPPVFAWRATFKTGALVSRPPVARWLYPDRVSTVSFSRVRLEPTWRPDTRVSFTAAYDLRLRIFSSPVTSVGAGVLPQESPPPHRVRPLVWNLSQGPHASLDHEIDRAAMRLDLPGVEITAGRQAIGWGRGVLFSAVDVFAPFTPLEADREWRRGVDALRADVKLSARSSAEVIGAFGPRWAESTIGARVRGYTDALDLEITAGRRAGDPFAGVSSSFPVKGAEVHAEAAAFRTAPIEGSRWFGVRRTVAKAVIGASYHVPVGAGLLVEAEYHYSGFGVRSSKDIVDLGSDPAFERRYLRGDTQTLTRHTVAAVASYEWSPLLSGGLQWLQNPLDGSGVFSPNCTITPGDRWSVLISGYAPYGRRPGTSTLRSEYGATPWSLFAEVRVYR